MTKSLSKVWHKLGPETKAQIIFIKELGLKHPKVLDQTFHIPNEKKVSPLNGFISQQMGTKPGVSDLFIAYPVGVFNGMFLEMKSEKGKLTKLQSIFLKNMQAAGFYAVVAYGAKQAMELVESYFNS